mgnify:CR=1 FL=1
MELPEVSMSHFLCNIPRESAAQRSPRRAQRSTVPLALAIVLGTFCVISPAGSALYKWTDANGRVVYSDQPPPGDVKVERIIASSTARESGRRKANGEQGGRGQEAAGRRRGKREEGGANACRCAKARQLVQGCPCRTLAR